MRLPPWSQPTVPVVLNRGSDGATSYVHPPSEVGTQFQTSIPLLPAAT